ncbi:MAG: nuclear transport factor 2 family protein, partial [Candidatus Eremiobacteraeota bacterium]|nr:nuclear transport factor 2 family protein [Candidatus Eremiobacteraeota bacterium]
LLFANAPHIHVDIEKRIVVGDVVIDEERITHTASGVDAHVAVIYEIADGEIVRVWVTRG